MNRRFSIGRIGIVLFVCWVALTACSARSVENTPLALNGLDLSGGGDYAMADQPRTFQFPRDYGAHDDFQTEWWYYTGNLATADGRQFGYELTFFRRAVQPADQRTPRQSPWAVEQVYMAHFAISDIEGGAFYPTQRLSRGSAGLAGATGDPAFSVWLEDWQVQQTGDNIYNLKAATGGNSLDLILTDASGPVLEGNRGLSRKGADPGDASYYFSQPDLTSSGVITLAGQKFTVSEVSWMDHEFSTSALGSGLVGWDWFSVHLGEGSELMLFTLRNSDGSLSPYSSATLIRPDGPTRVLGLNDFSVQVTGHWKSPHSGAEYPAGWQISIPGEQIELTIQPLLADQELNLFFIYWEGAVSISGTYAGQGVDNYGYVELTGYAQSMQGQF